MQFCIGVSITTKFDKHTCELFIITCAQFLYHTMLYSCEVMYIYIYFNLSVESYWISHQRSI